MARARAHRALEFGEGGRAQQLHLDLRAQGLECLQHGAGHGAQRHIRASARPGDHQQDAIGLGWPRHRRRRLAQGLPTTLADQAAEQGREVATTGGRVAQQLPGDGQEPRVVRADHQRALAQARPHRRWVRRAGVGIGLQLGEHPCEERLPPARHPLHQPGSPILLGAVGMPQVLLEIPRQVGGVLGPEWVAAWDRPRTTRVTSGALPLEHDPGVARVVDPHERHATLPRALLRG